MIDNCTSDKLGERIHVVGHGVSEVVVAGEHSGDSYVEHDDARDEFDKTTYRHPRYPTQSNDVDTFFLKSAGSVQSQLCCRWSSA